MPRWRRRPHSELREASQSWAESYLATEYRHGPISISAPGRVWCWAFGPLVPNFERDIAATGAHLEHRAVDAMADLIRAQRLCLLRAGDRGIDPDLPRNLARRDARPLDSGAALGPQTNEKRRLTLEDVERRFRRSAAVSDDFTRT